MEPWESLVDTSLPLFNQLCQLIERGSDYPHPELQVPLLAGYLCLNRKILQLHKGSCPLLLNYGPTGSGKSQYGVLVNGVTANGDILSSTSTFSSLRNHLNQYDSKSYSALVWDDLRPGTFHRDPRLLDLLKAGVSTSSSTIKIASKDGGNIAFNVYGPKIFSSIHPLFNEPELVELKRRMIVILHKLSSDSNKEFLDYEMVDFSGLLDHIAAVWETPSGFDYPWNRKIILDSLRGRVPANMPKMLADLGTVILMFSPDLLKSGVANLLANYWELLAQTIYQEKSSLHRWIEGYVKKHQLIVPLPDETHIAVRSKELRDALALAYANAEIDERPADNRIKDLMNLMGYKLEQSKILTVGVWTKYL